MTAALANHPLIEAARARIDAAKGSRLSAGAFPNPSGTYWVENTGFPGQRIPASLDRETSLYATLPLEPLLQRPARVRRADEELHAADARLQIARRQVASDAVRAFYRVALAQAAVEGADANRAGLEQLVAYNRARVMEGATAEGDLIRVQVEAERVATEAVLARVELARAAADLRAFVGGAAGLPSSPLRVTVAPESAVRGPVSGFDEVVRRARDTRPELLEWRARLAAATADTDYERSLKFRQLGATVGVKRVAGVSSMVAGISLTIPLFDANRGGVQRATAERLAAGHELAAAERAVTADVEAAYEAARQLSHQVAVLQGSFLDRAEESRRITLAAYQEGATSLLQVLDTSRTLADAHLTFYKALFAQRQSTFDLAVAGGSEPEAALTLVQSAG
ncbi:MAG: TolC family protein, partial [Acidobacteriota bacterium]